MHGRRSPALSGLRPAHGAAGGPYTPAYAALAGVADPAGLPPAYIEVTQLDMFRDEDLAYAPRLGQADVPVEFHCPALVRPSAGRPQYQHQRRISVVPASGVIM